MKIKNIVKHDLFKSSLIYTICDATNKAVPFFILPILSHYLLPADYGVVANFGVFTGIVALLISVNIDGAISVNYHRLNHQELRVYVFNALLICFCSFFILIFLGFLLRSWIYGIINIPFEYQFLGIIMCLMNLFTTLNLALWRQEEKPLYFGIYEITNTVFNLLASVIFVIILKLNWEGRISAMLLTSFCYGLISIYFLFKRKYIKITFKKKYFIDALLFGLPLIPHSISFWIRSGIDRAIITKFWGTESVGLYSTGFLFGTFISFLVGAFNNAYSPYLYKTLSNNNKEELKSSKYRLVRMTYYIMFGLIISGVFFMFLSYFILKYLFDERYWEAREYIYWAIAAQVGQGFYIMFVNYIFYSRKTKQLAYITFSCAICHAIISFFLVQYSGPIGAAYSSVIISFLNFVIVAIYSSRVYKMPWNLLKFRKTL
jgi:O-antigen/teichoic acid export membrane protein